MLCNFIAITVFLLFNLWSPHASAIDFKAIKWELVRSGSGIDVYRGETGLSDLYAAKGLGIIPAPIVIVTSVLLDPTRRGQWFPDLLGSHIVKTVSANERFEYMAVRTPFPLANRDFIYRGKFSYNKEVKTMEIRFASEDIPEMPETKLVRGKIIDSVFTLRERADGYTIIEHVAVMDPRGYIPNWIVNLVQANVPFNMIWNLRLQVVRPDVVARQEVLDEMK